MLREESTRQQQVDGQTRSARHKRTDEYRNQPTATALDGTGGNDGGHVAAEAHNQRDKRLAVKPDFVHYAVHNKRCARHIAGIFQERNKRIQNHNVGQKNNHAADATDYAVDNHIFYRTFGQTVAQHRANPLHEVVNPIHRILPDFERRPKHKPHD